MTSLHSALYALFNRLLQDDSTWFPGQRTATSFQCPTVVPEKLRGFIGDYNSAFRYIPDDSWAPGLVTNTKEWAELPALSQALKKFSRVARLPEAFADQLLERIIDQVLECYFDGISLLNGSCSISDGMCQWFLTEPAFNKTVLESCEVVSDRYETNIDTAKRETVYLPMEGLRVFPADELIPLIDDTTVIHLSGVSTPVLRRFLRDRRVYAIRGLPAYWVERKIDPVDEYRTTCSNGTQALEELERTVAAFRVAQPGVDCCSTGDSGLQSSLERAAHCCRESEPSVGRVLRFQDR